MAWFGNKIEEQKPVEEKPKGLSEPASASPDRSEFYNSIRTACFRNAAGYYQFSLAQQIDAEKDIWRVIEYSLHRNDINGKYTLETNPKGDAGFMAMLQTLSQSERFSRAISTLDQISDDDVKKLFPQEQYPELDPFFHDVEHFIKAAHIMQVTFDNLGQPRKRLHGIVFDKGTYSDDELQAAHKGPSAGIDNTTVAAMVEAGVLRELFLVAAARQSKTEEVLRASESLHVLDKMFEAVGSFYLSIQNIVGSNEGYSKVRGLQPQEKKDISARAAVNEVSSFDEIFSKSIPSIRACLDELKQQSIKIHTEPYEKTVAEFEVYTHLLKAGLILGPIKDGVSKPGGIDREKIAALRAETEEAKQKFMKLGGSSHQFSRIQGWVDLACEGVKKGTAANLLPSWVPEFISRYYDTRAKVMKKIQERSTASVATSVAVMGEDIKPSLGTEERAQAGAKPSKGPSAP